ncbi:RGS1-HXK1-interacting protein 1 [Amaranthus tricolor]|uniref:RGS1-HXK1-interacting protein 1 n=1 Tax=Amaranthus tricolor TaxID=29722 RepID=UPI00258A9904|nr:RGS1-HXK1-interacting protein 1 [Amaranthus tricolor]
MESNEGSSSPSIKNPPLTATDNFSVEAALKILEKQTNPWLQQTIEQAMIFQTTAEQTFNSAITTTRDRLSQILCSSSAHFQQTLESLKDVKAEYNAYETKFFGKVKEGAFFAGSNPLIATGAVIGLGFMGLKGPRRFLYYRTLRLFSTDEALLSRSNSSVKELMQSFERLKAETRNLEKKVSMAEEEMKRGRTKLRHAGHQIRKAILSANKIEKQARGLKDVLADLPRTDASKFNSQIKSLVAEAKQERKVLAKEVTKISNFGISI